jgi:hypothetical protein
MIPAIKSKAMSAVRRPARFVNDMDATASAERRAPARPCKRQRSIAVTVPLQQAAPNERSDIRGQGLGRSIRVPVHAEHRLEHHADELARRAVVEENGE